MGRARQLLKRTAERTLVGSGVPELLGVLRDERDLILTYHNIVPEDGSLGGDLSLHLPRSDFTRQLDFLASRRRVVPLSKVLSSTGLSGDGGRVALTFDDGYRGALTVGLEELEARSMPATFFICPGLLGSDALWWDALGAEARNRLPDSWSHTAQELARGVGAEVHRWAREHGIGAQSQPDHAGVVSELELLEAAESPSVTLAPHSWSHPNLSALDPTELEREVRRPMQWFDENPALVAEPWLSLPYGRSSPDVREAARAAGYRHVFDLSGKLLAAGEAAFELPRVNVPAGQTLDRFILRTVGI